MASLQLIKLACIRPEDWLGGDEPYIKVNGATVWGPGKLDNGQSVDLTAVAQIAFLGSATVQLFDQDVAAIGDQDDNLGILSVSSALAGTGPQTGTFSQDGADYSLTYQVS